MSEHEKGTGPSARRAVHYSSLHRLMQPAGPLESATELDRLLEAPAEPPPPAAAAAPAAATAPPAAPGTGYSMRVRKDGVEFELHGDRDFVAAEGQRLLEMLGLSQTGVAPAASGAQPLEASLRDALEQFLASIAVSGHPETVLALAYWLAERGHSPLGVADLEACYELLGLPASANFNADVNSLVRRKLLVEAARGPQGRKAWLLSEQGLSYIHDKLRTS